MKEFLHRSQLCSWPWQYESIQTSSKIIAKNACNDWHDFFQSSSGDRGVICCFSQIYLSPVYHSEPCNSWTSIYLLTFLMNSSVWNCFSSVCVAFPNMHVQYSDAAQWRFDWEKPPICMLWFSLHMLQCNKNTLQLLTIQDNTVQMCDWMFIVNQTYSTLAFYALCLLVRNQSHHWLQTCLRRWRGETGEGQVVGFFF